MPSKRQKLMAEEREREPMLPTTGEVRAAKRALKIGAKQFRAGQHIPDADWANAGHLKLVERENVKWLRADLANYDPPVVILPDEPMKPDPRGEVMDKIVAAAMSSSAIDVIAQGRALRDMVIAAMDPRRRGLWEDCVAAHDKASALYLRALGMSAQKGVPYRRIPNLDVGANGGV